jgi:hypothetical protein
MRQMIGGLVVAGQGVSACGYAVPSRGVSADIDAALWSALTSLYLNLQTIIHFNCLSRRARRIC